MNSDHPGRQIFVQQAPVVINQAAPVQDTYYPFTTLTNYRIYSIQVNIEDANEDLNVRITQDGLTPVVGTTLTAPHSTDHTVFMSPSAINRLNDFQLVSLGANLSRRASGFMLEGKSILVEVRKTTANGAGNLTGIIVWGQLEVVD